MIDESKVWTKDNLNECGNPLPQYEKFRAFKSSAAISAVGYLKIFDSVIQLDQNQIEEKDRTLNNVAFTLLIDTLYEGSYRERSLLDVSFKIKASDASLSNNIALNPLGVKFGRRLKGVIAYKKLTDTPTVTFDVKVYVYMPIANTEMRFMVLDFYTSGMLNRYATGGDNTNGKYTWLDRARRFIGLNIAYNNTEPTLPVGYSLVLTDSISTKEITITSGTSAGIYTETEVIKFGASAPHSIDTINSIGGYFPYGKIINLVFFNGYTTIVHTGVIDSSESNMICLKGDINVNPSLKGYTITLLYNGVKWIEIARNF